eukprot:8971248-Alexandrium_andersonii.AAC.1
MTEVAHSQHGHVLAHECLSALVANEKAARDARNVLSQGRPLTAPAPFVDDDASAGGRRFVFLLTHDPPFRKGEHAWGSETHRAL